MTPDDLSAWLATGPYDVRAADLTPPAARQVGERAGWQIAELATGPGSGKGDLLRQCAAAFELPRWFGGNWDALADSLRDLRPTEGRAGVLVVWSGSEHLPPADRATMIDILVERCDQRADFAALLVTD